MTQHSFQHEFKGYGRVPSVCSVKIFSNNGEHIIYFEDIGNGTSVTNASEQLATEIINRYAINPNECKFIETYRRDTKKLDGISYYYDLFDEITYDWTLKKGQWEAKNPDWKPASNEIRDLFINEDNQ